MTVVGFLLPQYMNKMFVSKLIFYNVSVYETCIATLNCL